MVGAPLKPLALLTLASWMRKAHRLCKAGDKSSKDPLVWYPNRRDILATASRLKAKPGGGIWMKSRHGEGVSFCKSRWVNLMARVFFFSPSVGRIFVRIDHWHRDKIGAIKIARAFVGFFFLSSLIQCINVLPIKAASQSQRDTRTRTHTDTHYSSLPMLSGLWLCVFSPTDLFIYSTKRQWCVCVKCYLCVNWCDPSCHCAAKL